MKTTPLNEKQVYNDCNPDQFQFDTTDELKEPDQALGQDRAMNALHYGIGITQKGYNIFALGPSGTGKHTTIKRFINARSGRPSKPHDWCYINNFNNPQQPYAIKLPAGKGKQLKNDMDHFVDDLIHTIPAAFDSDEYHFKIQEIRNKLEKQQEKAVAHIKQKAEKKKIVLIRTPDGYSFAPKHNGEVVNTEDFDQLPEDIQVLYSKNIESLEDELETALHDVPLWQRKSRNDSKQLNKKTTIATIKPLVSEIRSTWRRYHEVLKFIDEVKNAVIENAFDFIPTDEDPSSPFSNTHIANDPKFRRYKVNTLIDNSDTQSIPIIYEDNPTYNNLLGRSEYLSEYGALVTDFLLIKPGAVHKANGGYLIIDADKLLEHDFSWEGLKRALSKQQLKIEPLEKMLSLNSTVTLEPQAIPLDVKVILIGNRDLYYLLCEYDADFNKLFKVAVDFEEDIIRNVDNNLKYAHLIASLTRTKKLLPLSFNAVARVIEQSARWQEDQNKLSLHTHRLIDLLCEANFWAKEKKQKLIQADHIQIAIDKKHYRQNRMQLQVDRLIQENTLLIETETEVIGQINGLSVMSLGDMSFGAPSKITATVRPGDGGVLDIEREVDLGGAVHSKGVLILSGFLNERYGIHHTISFSANLVFEQSYDGIDGDSASSAELYALLSVLAEAPIKQNFAVTGSVNQKGMIQPVGGINEKIEGFFRICQHYGLNGQHGVLIPESNVRNLMLNSDVVQAVAEHQFSIYPIKTIEQGIEMLTGMSAGKLSAKGKFPPRSIHGRVLKKLKQFSSLLESKEKDHD